MKKLIENEKFISYLFIIIVSIIVSIPLINNNIDVVRDDGIQHVCRLMGTYQTILEGQPFFSIMSNFCNGFGYSWNIFYSPLTAFVPLIFSIFTDSFVLMLKLFMFLTILLSGIFMNKFAYEITGNKKISTIASIIYITAPYHLTDMYIRVAVAELTSFVFIPLVFLGLYNIFEREGDKAYFLSIGAIGLILTHTISTFIVVFFSIIYVICNIKKLKDWKVIKPILINALLIILTVSFFILPMLEHMNATTYEVFIPDRMADNEFLNSRKINAVQLFYTEEKNIVFEIGLLTVVGLIISLFCIKKIPKEYLKLYIIFLIFGILSILITLKQIPIRLPNFLNIIQFPWRMLEFSTFFLSIVTAIGFAYITKKFTYVDVLILSILAVLLLLPLVKFIAEVDNFNETPFYEGIRVEHNTGRVHAGLASFEYLPEKAFDNKAYIVERTQDVYVLSGKAEISNLNKNNSEMTFDVSNVEGESILELPYIYYLGYDVELNMDNQVIKIDTFESDNGFVAIKLDNIDEGSINVEYTGTTLMKVSYVISFVGFILLVVYIVKNVLKNKKTEKCRGD